MAVEEETKNNQKKGFPIKIVALGLVAGLLIGGGGFFFLKKDAPENKNEPSLVSEETSESELSEEETVEVIYDLEPFIVNLADSPELRYLKITIKLDLFKPSYVDDINKKVPQVRDNLLILLSSKESATIRTVEGKMELRDEILQRINRVFNENKVRTAYFTDFVMQ
ncbi:MAG: flagellar basal body-associated protein FliL [Nitrospiria bacterium]